MEGNDCGRKGKLLGGVTIFSHPWTDDASSYGNNIECRLTFKAENDDWKLMMRVVELDIPDKSFNELCNDAVYVYDASTIMGRPVKQAGGNGGLCGNELPPVIYSTGPYLTIYFRTDSSGPKGKGFKIIITAYNDDYENYESCGQHFKCENNKCIDGSLTCDAVDHCGDFSDEAAYEGPKCGKLVEDSIISKFLSLGVTAAISIAVGSVVIFVVCTVCVVCCCCRCWRKRSQDPGGGPSSHQHTTTTATSVTINNGGPPAMPMPIYHPGTPEPHNHYIAHPYQHGYVQQGYYPMQQVHPAVGQPGHHPGHPAHHPVHHPAHHPGHPGHPGHPSSVTYSPYPQRESYSHSQQGSVYSSQPPPSYHRSYTPTSSKSARSHHSNDDGGSSSVVKYHNHGSEKVALPVNL